MLIAVTLPHRPATAATAKSCGTLERCLDGRLRRGLRACARNGGMSAILPRRPLPEARSAYRGPAAALPASTSRPRRRTGTSGRCPAPPSIGGSGPIRAPWLRGSAF